MAQVRWGILGTAGIARSSFLPGLQHAGGVAAAVAGRDGARAERYALDNQIERGLAGYLPLVEDPGIDALYIPLPNSLHAEWTIRALRAGRPVLCEKPLCGTLADTERVLAVARETGTPLWEAFVFPFHAQFAATRDLVAGGAIGELREIQSSFHFALDSAGDIRLSAELQGGALRDLGCYPVALAGELFGTGHESAWADAEWSGQGHASGVDLESFGVLGYPGGRRLLLSCGLRRSYDTGTRLLGTAGQICLTNPFHPDARDTFEVTVPGADTRVRKATYEPSFAPAIRHINAVLHGEEEPRHLAVDTSLATARALHDLLESASSRPEG